MISIAGTLLALWSLPVHADVALTNDVDVGDTVGPIVPLTTNGMSDYDFTTNVLDMADFNIMNPN
ncbi:MAG: hypothetical protein AAF492_06510, partial [Verrucomicrobiota bacterium]